MILCVEFRGVSRIFCGSDRVRDRSTATPTVPNIARANTAALWRGRSNCVTRAWHPGKDLGMRVNSAVDAETKARGICLDGYLNRGWSWTWTDCLLGVSAARREDCVRRIHGVNSVAAGTQSGCIE
jgi:hypothetical protein